MIYKSVLLIHDATQKGTQFKCTMNFHGAIEKPAAPSPTCAKRIRREFRFRFGSKPGFTRFLAANFKTKRIPMVLHAKYL